MAVINQLSLLAVIQLPNQSMVKYLFYDAKHVEAKNNKPEEYDFQIPELDELEEMFYQELLAENTYNEVDYEQLFWGDI
ncbi:hypothetical protein [Evansella cellulosilytica]|uniref:Uncharacterized protein n=1 Tax=Evansella cellulosilytica (strain ATCC 21833 / DSM 2522 / FERM P-1141 / JCM 9156 / N-4) TaxID=649639 RepID=E6TZU4_EVAC2|nr:hypothetical protein [Evansella cellulosilytica]ADU32510.1 hypothetical protein Bcell_4283 [Evansella cellulosilytica DSM 2522]